MDIRKCQNCIHHKVYRIGDIADYCIPLGGDWRHMFELPCKDRNKKVCKAIRDSVKENRYLIVDNDGNILYALDSLLWTVQYKIGNEKQINNTMYIFDNQQKRFLDESEYEEFANMNLVYNAEDGTWKTQD